MESRPQALYHRPFTVYHPAMIDLITFNANPCGGRPCLCGMRIQVKDVPDLSAAGVLHAEILEGRRV